MENFVYEYPTKVYFGKEAAKTHLPGILAAYGPNVLLAYGGGSVIDCCKIVCAQAVEEENLWELEMQEHKTPSKEPIPLGAVVTASDTGAEMNEGPSSPTRRQKSRAACFPVPPGSLFWTRRTP